MPAQLLNGVPGALLPLDDLGLLRGLSVFDTLRTYGLEPFRFDAHIDRLYASAAAFHIPTPPRDVLEATIREHLEPDCRVRITLTGSANWIVDVAPLDLDYVGRPIRVGTLSWRPPDTLSGAVKHTNRAAWQVASRRLGVDEVLLVDPADDVILEANRSNVIAVVEGRLRTPPTDGRQLAGVTRGAVIDAARRAGLPMDVAPLPASAPWTELYVCSTLKEISPVVEVNGVEGPGSGPLGGALHAALRELIAAECGGA